jgi:hypothetical protein
MSGEGGLPDGEEARASRAAILSGYSAHWSKKTNTRRKVNVSLTTFRNQLVAELVALSNFAA